MLETDWEKLQRIKEKTEFLWRVSPDLNWLIHTLEEKLKENSENGKG